MSSEQGGRWKKPLAAVVLIVGGIFVFDWTRWWVFETRIHNVLLALPHEPRATELVGIRGTVIAQASSLWIPASSLDLEIHCEQHASNGYAAKEDMLECYWFVVVTATHGKRSATWEQRIDNKVPETDQESLEAAGIRVVKRKGPQSG